MAWPLVFHGSDKLWIAGLHIRTYDAQVEVPNGRIAVSGGHRSGRFPQKPGRPAIVTRKAGSRIDLRPRIAPMRIPIW